MLLIIPLFLPFFIQIGFLLPCGPSSLCRIGSISLYCHKRKTATTNHNNTSQALHAAVHLYIFVPPIHVYVVSWNLLPVKTFPLIFFVTFFHHLRLFCVIFCCILFSVVLTKFTLITKNSEMKNSTYFHHRHVDASQ
jgi:hypothetical protein